MAPATIRNPVLPGSHPDPSIIRVAMDYYIATSTFEWYPGVRLHHSRDLIHWQTVDGALDATHLDLAGCPDSGGVWAPSLSHVDGLFHLVYSNVSAYAGGFTDSPNYAVTAPTIQGPWSAPTFLHSRGFDASLFHDGTDSWLLNLVHDWRPGHGGSAGLEMTRYDRRSRRLVGPPRPIELQPGTGWIEGPNLYRRGDWYYLLTADGGTGFEHQVTVSRARQLHGPYRRNPNGPLITAKGDPELPLQKAGHGSLVQTANGQWYLAYLASRPQGTRGPCILGRETALAVVEWTVDDWPRIPGGVPALEIPAPEAPARVIEAPRSDGESASRSALGPQWSTLRRPAADSWISRSPGGGLRIRGGRSPASLVEQSLVARRVTAGRTAFETDLGYWPEGFQHLAGICAYYNTRNWYFLHVTTGDDDITTLRLAISDRSVVTTLNVPEADLSMASSVRLGLDLDGATISFRYRIGGIWHRCGPDLDATILSDEHAMEFEADGRIRSLGFTGAFVGLWVWDLADHGHRAEFADITYQPAPQSRDLRF